MRVVYIAMPYRADTVYGILQNIRAAERLALKYWKMGYAVICPHKNTSLFDGAAPDEVWLEGDLELLRRADIIVMGPGWKNSSGAQAELEVARRWDKEIIIDDGTPNTNWVDRAWPVTYGRQDATSA